MVSAQRLRIDAAREGRKSQQAEPQPPHQSQLNEAARTELPVSADLEIEARSIQTVHPAACKFANSDGDYPVRFIDFLGDVQDYTLAGFYGQAKRGSICS